MAVQNYMLRYLFGISLSILEILISQTKVCNFANIVVIKKNVTSCQVTMDYLQDDVTLHFKNTNCQKMQYNLVIVFLKKKKTHKLMSFNWETANLKGVSKVRSDLKLLFFLNKSIVS